MESKKNRFHYFFILFIFITVLKSVFALKNKEEIISSNELKIDIYPENKQKDNLQKSSLKELINENTVKYSFDSNEEFSLKVFIMLIFNIYQ